MCLPHTRGDEPELFLLTETVRQRLPHTRGDEPPSDRDMASVSAPSAPHAWG